VKGLEVVLCLAAVVSAAQADPVNCRWVGRCSTPGHASCVAVPGSRTHAVHDAFGLRTIEVVDAQSLTEGAYFFAQDSAWRAHVPGGDYVAEAGGALLGGALVGAGATVVLGVAGGALLSSHDAAGEDWGARLGAVLGGALGVVLGYPSGCGLGTTIVGKALRADGNSGAAYGGAYAGMAAGMTVGVLAGLVTARWEAGLLAAGVLPPAGAVIGYNTGAPRNDAQSSLGARLAPPMLAYRTRLGPERQRYLSFDCRLVTVRF
jgi:hypothetical protein